MDQELLDRFFKGDCSEKESRKVLAWYLSGDADVEIADKMERHWNAPLNQLPTWNKENLFKSIDQQTRLISGPITNDQVENNFIQQNRKVWRNIAATLILAILVSYLYIYLGTQDFAFFQADRIDEKQVQEGPIFKKTAKGEKLTIILQDSTVIKLNSESQLKYQSTSSREVYLEGEAFFEVSRDTLHPFLIHTGEVTTTVLGTSFNVKAFAEEEVLAVSVVSGEVKVEKNILGKPQMIQLKPGEQAQYQLQDSLFTKKLFDYQQDVSWKDGKLFFKNASFAEIDTALERWYGVEIEIRSGAIEKGFSGSYTNRSLENVLEGMSFVLGFDYEIQDKKVIIN